MEAHMFIRHTSQILTRIITAVTAAILIVGCGSDGSGWPAEYRLRQLESCEEKFGSEQDCQCIVTEMEKQLSFDQVVEFMAAESGKDVMSWGPSAIEVNYSIVEPCLNFSSQP